MRLTKEELSELLEIAKHAATLARDVHRRALTEVAIQADTKSSTSDLVTEVDRESERVLVKAIHAARPNDEIISEEGTKLSGSSGVRWVLDPLDGTTNFIHRYSMHSVAVGVEIDARPLLGVVHDTFNDRVYAGIAGQGATCENKPIEVRNESDLSRALIGTGFLPDAEVRRAQADLLRHVLPRVRDVRRSGCPSLDICNVASGALDGFYECGLGPWDIAAAAAVAEAAGAKISLLHSNIFPDPFVVVANPDLSAALVGLLIEAKAAEAQENVPNNRIEF